MFLIFFGMVNIDEIQGIGLDTGSITPELCNSSRLLLILPRSAT